MALSTGVPNQCSRFPLQFWHWWLISGFVGWTSRLLQTGCISGRDAQHQNPGNVGFCFVLLHARRSEGTHPRFLTCRLLPQGLARIEQALKHIYALANYVPKLPCRDMVPHCALEKPKAPSWGVSHQFFAFVETQKQMLAKSRVLFNFTYREIKVYKPQALQPGFATCDIL